LSAVGTGPESSPPSSGALVLVLVAAAAVSHLLGERVETGVILVLVAVNVAAAPAALAGSG